MGLFDVHAHLTSPRFAEDLPEVLERARDAGVTTIVSNGLNLADNRKTLELAAREPLVKAAIGFYPVDTVLPEMLAAGIQYPREDVEEASIDDTLAFVRDHAEQAVAIGEIGLDHHWVPEPFWQQQEDVFRRLVRLAQDADKPIIIHTRKAEARTLEILLEMKAERVDWHCYSSRLSLAKRIAEAGHYLSVPANARRSETFTGLLRSLPRSQLLLETDCPYLAPESGSRNEPKNVAGTVDYAAELWGTSSASALEQLAENFERLFGFAP
ncbi:MAG TPA: TatD family hydrolase [Polyangiaceae bacterium]|nr:TatD family hydrolase [Polyangiaceae bacterium]